MSDATRPIPIKNRALDSRHARGLIVAADLGLHFVIRFLLEWWLRIWNFVRYQISVQRVAE